MQGNFIMLQMDDLKQVVTEIVEKVCARRRLSEKPTKGDGDWLTREEVCGMLHITYTTLWRNENDRWRFWHDKWGKDPGLKEDMNDYYLMEELIEKKKK